MISPAIIPALEALGLDIVWAVTPEGKFISANGALVDLSGFRGEELERFGSLDNDRKATLLENIAYHAGFTVDVAGNENDTEQAIVVEAPVVEPEAPATEEAPKVIDMPSETPEVATEAPADVTTPEEAIEAPATEEAEAEKVPAKKASKKA